MSTIPAPNYTQIPNVILDRMHEMDETELRIILAIARQTFGWHKKRDKISLTQLQKMTGLSRQGVINGSAKGEERGFIEKIKDENDKRGGFWYRLLVNSIDQSTELTSPEDRPVNGVDQSTELTRSSQLSRPDLVNSVDTQKKGNKPKEKDGGGGDTPPDHVRYLADKNVGAAHLFKDCDPTATITLYNLMVSEGWKNGSIVENWKKSPPTPDRVKQFQEETHAKDQPQRLQPDQKRSPRAPRPGERGYTGRS